MKEKLTVSEIRIGNYIQSGNNGVFAGDGTHGKVLSINQEEVDFEQVYCECEESYDWFFKDNYFGIPLTEELLIKLSYDLADDDTYTYDDICVDTKAASDAYDVSIWRTKEWVHLTWITDVHQLQNIHFLIGKGELTIK